MSRSSTTAKPRYPTAAPAAAAAKRDLLGMSDLDGDLELILSAATTLKRLNKTGHPTPLLAGKSACLVFEKPSTRTRVSFEIGLAKLGATSVFLSTRDLQLGRGESVEDTAFVLSRYADALVYRANSAADVAELAVNATVPVINALDDREHPCQVVADLLTILEHKGHLAGLKFLYVGDGNNMSHSYLLGCAATGMHITVATPPGYEPASDVVAAAQVVAQANGGSVTLRHGVDGAFTDQDVVATDTWVSMGDETEKEDRLSAFAGFTVTEAAMAAAAPDAIFLHCLPAYYGLEVDKAVAHGPQSVVFDEAENRMWAQMALMVWAMAPWRLDALAADSA